MHPVIHTIYTTALWDGWHHGRSVAVGVRSLQYEVLSLPLHHHTRQGMAVYDRNPGSRSFPFQEGRVFDIGRNLRSLKIGQTTNTWGLPKLLQNSGVSGLETERKYECASE